MVIRAVIVVVVPGYEGNHTRNYCELHVGGAMAGVPSLVAARLGCFEEVWATDGGDVDVEDNLEDLRRNLDANGSGEGGEWPVYVRRLEWGEAGLSPAWPALAGAGVETAARQPLGCIMGSELVYEPACVPLLLQTLAQLSGPQTVILLYVTERHPRASAAFWRQVSHSQPAQPCSSASQPSSCLVSRQWLVAARAQ
jgi:predicted nicotinamide N-methyase